MRYEIVESNRSAYRLQSKVNEYLARGWKPLGGVSVSISMSQEVWAQAMIKED